MVAAMARTIGIDEVGFNCEGDRGVMITSGLPSSREER